MLRLGESAQVKTIRPYKRFIIEILKYIFLRNCGFVLFVKEKLHYV
jgi:hypothetical protein